MLLRTACALTVSAFCFILADAASAQDDRSHYSLFAPAPDDRLRGIDITRPAVTEGPGTVDAGHVVVEMNAWNQVIDRAVSQGVKLRTTDTSYGSFNAKTGLTSDVELDIIMNPIHAVQIRNDATGAPLDRTTGLGDVTAALKVNIFGNDSGDVALTLMPYIRVPTGIRMSGTSDVTGGVIVPVGIKLGERTNLFLMSKVDLGRTASNTDYAATFINSAAVGYAVTDQIGIYGEVAATCTAVSRADWQVTVGGGVRFAVSESFQVNAGINGGATAAAPDFGPFVGITFRF